MREFFRAMGRLMGRILRGIGGAILLLFPAIATLWHAGNRILRRAILFFFFFPVLISLVSLLGETWITATFSLIALLVLGLVLLARIDPLIIGIAALIKPLRAGLNTLIVGLTGEVLLAVFFSVFNVSVAKGLVPVFLLVLLAIFLISANGLAKKKDDGKSPNFFALARAGLIVVAVLITCGFVVSSLLPKSWNDKHLILERADSGLDAAILDTAKPVAKPISYHPPVVSPMMPVSGNPPTLSSVQSVDTLTINVTSEWQSFSIPSWARHEWRIASGPYRMQFSDGSTYTGPSGLDVGSFGNHYPYAGKVQSLGGEPVTLKIAYR